MVDITTDFALYNKYGYVTCECPDTGTKLKIEKCYSCHYFIKYIEDKIYCNLALQNNIQKEGNIRLC